MEAVTPKMRLKGWVSRGIEEGKCPRCGEADARLSEGKRKSRYVRSAENEEEEMRLGVKDKEGKRQAPHFPQYTLRRILDWTNEGTQGRAHCRETVLQGQRWSILSVLSTYLDFSV